MRSSLYECRIVHHRSSPREHHFTYNVFLFALDLDEIDEVARRVLLFSHNRWNACTFRDDDHLPGSSMTIRENVEEFIRQRGVSERPSRILLLTSARIFGYVFNPVSYYLCFGEDGKPLCAIPEINNTYGEMKPFFIGGSDFTDGSFRQRVTKHFYISPFLDLSDQLEFRIEPPEEKLRISTDTWRGEERILSAAISGTRRPLTTASLALCLLKFPLVTLQIITAIHWEAFRLWLKGIHYHPKKERIAEQRDIVKGRSAA
ncbi:MAG TPA: DUF1365 domain-containing protein [Thermoanaerobaculia bacterium]|nr:DUF1365 domain-containing protein [Thermoanaerobaculia bacterium]